MTVDQAISELERLSEVYGDHELTIKFGAFTFSVRELERHDTKFEVIMTADVRVLPQVHKTLADQGEMKEKRV